MEIPRERPATDAFLRRMLRIARMRPLGAYLFGSRARGDAGAGSDTDVLLLCDLDARHRAAANATAARLARRINAATGHRLDPWVVPLGDLRQGRRTPMLVDALADALTLWPRGRPPPRIRFTPADARFCTRRLLDWVEAGGPRTRSALKEGRFASAARRARDDITRLATAALLLTGDTRHRGRGTLHRFEIRLVRSGAIDRKVLPALRWAALAFPHHARWGRRPPATKYAVRTAPLGYRLAGVMEAATLPWLLARLSPRDAIPPPAPPPWNPAARWPGSGIRPYAGT